MLYDAGEAKLEYIYHDIKLESRWTQGIPCLLFTCLPHSMTTIAVIGAGASGLAQIKQAIDAFARPESPTEALIVGFESKDQVGGVW
jgi:hypothetical protein